MVNKLGQVIKPYIQLTRIDRPIGTLLLLWPTLTALWLAAGGFPDVKILLIFIAGVVLMRSAGCAINDFADRHVDGQVARTSQRPLATGALTARQALLTFVILALLAFLLVLQLNTFTILLSFGAVILAALYPFMKRYTHLPQVVLGMAFGWAIPMAFAAQTGEVPLIAWLFFLANIVWTVVYDTFYAMADRTDDEKIGVKSTAILFGQYDLLIQSVLQLLYISAWLLMAWLLSFSWVVYLAIVISAGLFIYQQYLAKNREPKNCFQAFLNNNWVGLILFFSVVIHYLWV